MSSRYLQPKTLEELQRQISELTDASVVLAGGTDLMVKIRERRPEIDTYLSLFQVQELGQIRQEGGRLKIGAMVTHDTVACNDLVEQYFTGLKMACGHVGSQQIRNKGTLCGNVVNASPAGDVIPCMYLYNGQVEILSANGLRRVGIDAFYQPNGRTVLGKQEVVTALWLPIQEGRNSCFVKLGARTEVTIAQLSLCVSWLGKEGNRTDIRAYMGAVDTRPVEFRGPELLKNSEEDSLEQAAQILREQIREIRLRRTRESKLKITEAEKLYKERAARGIIYDAAQQMCAVERKG